MGTLLLIGALILVGYLTYKHGKQIGSRMAYRIGHRHGQRLQRQSRFRDR